MNSFQLNTQSVLEYLAGHSCGQSSYSLCHSCYVQLGQYLTDNSLDYSRENAQRWLEGQAKSQCTLQAYAKAIQRLDDIYTTGSIQTANQLRQPLPAVYDDMIASYLSHISEACSESHLLNIRGRCTFFFRFLQQEQKLLSPYEISYSDILAFYQGPLSRLSRADTCMYKGTVQKFLFWMAGRHVCTVGLPLVLHADRAGKLIMLGELPEADAETVRCLGNESYSVFPPDEFYSASQEFCNSLKELGYASTMNTSAKATLELLYLFLDMNHLGYHPVIAWKWFETAGVCFGTNSCMSRRVLALFEMYIQEGIIRPERTFVYKGLLFDSLPAWCQKPLGMFLQQKHREQKAASTITMYRSANVRFCRFLDTEGLTAFSQVTAEHLKKFNLLDMHETVEGKNAYNVRIRKFLFYLADQGYVDNFFLGEALPCASAPKTRVVQVLSDEEILRLEQYDRPDDPALGLRNRAILLIGLRMGLRASDVASLELSHIDWKNRSIRFMQDKTAVEKILPMPTDVGNALYRYLSEGRPQSGSRYIFITHKAPYRKIGRGVCRHIIAETFPEASEKRMGFHITRRTYATQRFRNNCSCSAVADLLGHTDAETVHKYISLDEERMRLCPIPLKSAGIPLEGGFLDE